jgi:hypothetical protein
MFPLWLNLFKTTVTGPGARTRRGRRPGALEPLEGRVLLSSFTVYTVTDNSDNPSDTGSLPYAVNEANNNPNTAGSLILFSLPTSPPSTITLDSTLELSEKAGPELITGPGASYLTISGNNAVEVFQVDSNANATIGGLTITKGLAETNGGGINNLGTLTLDSCTVTNNTALGLFAPGESFVGGQGGGINNQGTLTIAGGTIASNTAGANGGGIYNDGTLSISDANIASNVAEGTTEDSRDAAYFIAGQGAGIFNQSQLSIADSTIANNEGFDGGGGLGNSGKGTVTDCTVAGNSTIWGDGGGINNTGTVAVTNCTIADNSAGYDGGGVSNSGTATLNNTIVALNTLTVSDAANDVGSTTSNLAPASANNLIGTGGSGGLTNGVDGNQVGVADPGLGPLASNGGPTQTMALLAGSPAIEKGSVALDSAQATDQRGSGYGRLDRFGLVDIGAYEYVIPFPTHIFMLTETLVSPHPIFHENQLTSVVLEAEIEPMTTGASMPTGTVTFEVAIKSMRKKAVTEEVLGMAELMGGEAMLTVKAGKVLNRAITVVYSGDANDLSSMDTPPDLTLHTLKRLRPTMDRVLGRPSLRRRGHAGSPSESRSVDERGKV